MGEFSRGDFDGGGEFQSLSAEASEDAPSIVVSGAGTAAVNGGYDQTQPIAEAGGIYYQHNTNPNYSIKIDDWDGEGNYLFGLFSDSDGVYIYSTNGYYPTPQAAPWLTEGAGVEPPPTVTAG